MFSFFHRRSTITVDCFTYDRFTYEYSPIVRSTRCYPQWWKDLPESGRYNENLESQNNMKGCFGFLELHKKSFTLRSWSDIIVSVTENEGYRYDFRNVASEPVASEHGSEQRGVSFENFYHIKLHSPWVLKESTGVDFAFVGNVWANDHTNFIVPNGILNFKYQSSSHINLFMPKRNNQFIIELNRPMINLIPLTDKKVVFKNHLVEKPEWEKIRFFSGNLNGGLLKGMYILKEEQRKCPFGFGR